MYGKGSYNSQFHRGPPTPMPPPYQQQLPGPPPLPSHFPQGRPAPRSSVFQPGPMIYQHGPSIPPPAVRQIPPDATLSTSQLYRHPQPTVHRSALLQHMYSTDQQNKQLPSHLGTQNVHHMSPSILPQPPRVLPPPLPPATMYKAPVHQQSQQPGGVQDLQHMPLLPPPPPPPTSSSFTSNPFGSFVQSTERNSHMPSVAPLPPPPPPSDPPPIPPSPPPPTSPVFLTHQQAASNLTSFNRPYGSKVGTSAYIEKDVTTFEVRHNVALDVEPLNQKCSSVGDSLLLSGSVMLDLPSPPPKPTEEKVIQKIQDLCLLIAKNGPAYEDLVRQNESGNPEYEFLFAGDPGSEAAIVHEYFLWMKKKCIFACKFNEGKSDPPLRPSDTVLSMQPNHLEVASTTYSPADSDMEMEDDITQSGNDPGMNLSTEGINSAYDLIPSELDVKEQSHKQRMSESENVAFTAPVLVEQGQKVVSSHDQLAFERPVSKVCSPLINSTDQLPLTSNVKKSATASVDEKIPSGILVLVAAQCHNSERKSSQLVKGGSPFRLLQDYASNDISENEDSEFFSPLKDSSSAAVGATSPYINERSNMLVKTENFLEDSGREVKEIAISSITSGTSYEHVNDKRGNQASINHDESPQDFQKKDASADASVDVCLNGKFQKECEEKGAKSASNSLKVDEFGRLVREGASESDSDDSRYNGRQCKRGRSRSRSPLDRLSRRSPWRRRDKRSRSCSWSPRNRRSRSRSPIRRSPIRRRSSRSPASKHAGEVGGDGMRRGRGQIPECFDFLRGRCYRGASCRYLHHDSDKGDGPKHHRSKQQYLEIPLIPKNSNIHGEVKHNLQKVSDKQHHEVKISEMQLGQDMAGSSFVVRKDMHFSQKREDSVSDASQSGSVVHDSQLIASHSARSWSSREAAAEMLETRVLPQEERKVLTTLTNKSCQEAMESTHPVDDDDTLKSHGDASQDILPLEDPLTKPSLSKLSDPLLQNADCPPQPTDNSCISDSFLEQTSVTSVNKLPVTEALPNTTDFRHHSAQLPPPPPALSEGVTAQRMSQPLGDYNLIPQSASFSSQSASGERFPSYMLPNQQSHFSSSPITSWTPLPPPPPNIPPQLQASLLPPRNDFGSQIRPYAAAELPTSQVGDFPQQAFPPMQESDRSVSREEDFRLKHLPPYNLPMQQFIGSGLLKKDHLTHLPTLELSASKMQSFPGDNLPPGELLKSSSQTHPYLQQQQPPYSLHRPASVSSSSRYPSDFQEANQSSHPPDFSGSRNSTYYNPYASTFEQPSSSKVSTDVFRQEDTTYNSKYASPFSMIHAQDDGRDIGCVGSRQATSSPNSAKAVRQNFPRSGGDQYDPLLDSFDPCSSFTKKIINVQKWEPSSDSDVMLKHSGSNKPWDVEENNKKKEIEGIALATFVDNEEYGETADAEVGTVENESPSNPIDAANMNVGDIEIDQIKSPGKSKKNKEDSRSMKLFKVGLADFVKEVLKPSWRQGNMSKEAFKTIVKKTVDKVSGAMKSHQIPKSQAKIDQYIVSSQWKLTKLVMGYVDKYVKM